MIVKIKASQAHHRWPIDRTVRAWIGSRLEDFGLFNTYIRGPCQPADRDRIARHDNQPYLSASFSLRFAAAPAGRGARP
jgi:hypothetical protein